MKTNLKIRAFRNKDRNELLDILKLNVPSYFAEEEIDDYKNFLVESVQKYFIAEVDKKIVGAGGINFQKENRMARISWDFVSPEYQNKGIGSKLLQHRLDLLDSMETIETIMVRTSQMAYKFYEKNGFILKEIHKDYWAEGYDMYKLVYKEPK